MGLADKSKAAHVRSAKKWLEKAERSFDNQATVQGELNLMLAEAEMENLRQQHGNRLRLRIAVVVALCLLCLGGTVLKHQLTEKRPIPIEKTTAEATMPALSKKIPAPAVEAVPEETVSPVLDSTEASDKETNPAGPILQAETGREMSQAETKPIPVQHKTVPAAKPILTEQQVQEVVQDARHSLRGTTIQNK